MATLTALVRLLPTAFLGRLALAFVEIALAAVILSGSVVLGHDLKEWREWYADSGTHKPWAPTPRPTAGPVSEPRP